MTRLSELLGRERLLARPSIPAEPVAVVRAAKRIRRRWPYAEALDPETDAEMLALEMERRRRADDWRDFYWADVTRTANVFLGGDLWRERRFRGLLDFLLEQIGSGARLVYLRAMFRKYLETFDPESSLTRGLAEALRMCWRETGLPIDRLIHYFGVFDIDAAPYQKLAEYMDRVSEPFQTLRGEGIEAPHGPGLMQLAHRRFVSALAPRIAEGDFAATEKLLDWLSPESARVPLEGPDASAAIDALLLPWRLHDPDQGLKNVIETRLIGAYGDPRIKNIGVWRTCSDDARRVILKWLTGATLKVFFDIVSEAEHSHMWPDRRQLWIDLFEKGRITQAWFALSERGAAIARRLIQERKGASLKFARNKSRTAKDRYKCLLIMNVDDRWVVEGSHSFPTWVFPRGNLSTLRPYEERYTCDQIRYFQGLEKPERIVHLGDWRNKVLAALQQ